MFKLNGKETRELNPPTNVVRSSVYLLLWLGFIFATSCTVVRPRELYSIVRYLTGASDASLEQFKLFWFTSWFAIVKGWHFTEFAIATLLVNQVVAWLRGIRDFRTIAISMVFTAVYAISDEWHQSFVPDRIGSIEDVVIDCLGIGAAGILLISRYIRENKRMARGRETTEIV